MKICFMRRMIRTLIPFMVSVVCLSFCFASYLGLLHVYAAFLLLIITHCIFAYMYSLQMPSTFLNKLVICHLIRITKMWLYFIYIYILNEYITMPYWNLYHVNIIQLRGLCVLTLRTPHYIIHSHVSTMIIYLYFACTSLMLMNILIQNTETFLRVILYLSQFYAF